MNCHSCGAELSASARFCHKCGAKVAQEQTSGWRAGLPWAIAGLSVGALVTILTVRLSGGGGGGESEGPGVPQSTGAVSGGMGRTDISQMTPEQRANRLFDRVMRHSEAGQQDSVQFFMPMALQAHRMLPDLSVDSRFHLGLLQLAGEDPAGALAQADTIQRAEPGHLFIHVLRARALEQQGDNAGARRAYAEYLRGEAAERAKQRPEYIDHTTTLDLFRDESRRRNTR